MSKLIISMTLIVFTLNAYGYTPTLNSLLRNGNNVEIEKNTIQANLYIVEIDPESNVELKDDSGHRKREFLKLLFINSVKNPPLMTQINYKGGILSPGTVANYVSARASEMQIFSMGNENVDAEMFYAVMSMLVNNSGNLLVNFLKKHADDIKHNTEMINEDKLNLLVSYKNYLLEQRHTRDEEEEKIENPMAPTEEEKSAIVKDISKQTFFKKDNLVKRVKVEDEFYWTVDTKNLYIKFDFTHRIREFRLKTELGSLEFVFGKFIDFGNKIEFPEFIWFKNLSGRKYLVKAKKLLLYGQNMDDYKKLMSRYQEHIERNKINDLENKPSFLL